MIEEYKKSYKAQSLSYVKSMEHKLNTKSQKKLDIWKSMEHLKQLDTYNQSVTMALNLQNLVSPTSNLLNIDTSELFSKEEWSTLSTSKKILYIKKFRKLYSNVKDWSWLPLLGFLAHLGKLLLLKEFGGYPSWTILCESFPLGCALSSEHKYHENNVPITNKSRYGKYKQFCGFKNLKMSFSHNKFVVNQLEKMKHKLPEEAIYILRFFTFTAWHSPKQPIHRAYPYFTDNYDWKMLPLLKLFNLYYNGYTIEDVMDMKKNNLLKQFVEQSKEQDNSDHAKLNIKKKFLRLKRRYLSRWFI